MTVKRICRFKSTRMRMTCTHSCNKTPSSKYNNNLGAKAKTVPTSAKKKGTPKKQKMSVARRLSTLPSPRFNNTLLLPLFNDDIFNAESEKADRNREAAQQMLLHAQREAELAKKRREAQEAKNEVLTLQKQMQKDNKKADQQKVRYDRQVHKNTNYDAYDNSVMGEKLKYKRNQTVWCR